MPSSGNPAEMGQYASAGPFWRVDFAAQRLEDGKAGKVWVRCGWLVGLWRFGESWKNTKESSLFVRGQEPVERIYANPSFLA